MEQANLIVKFSRARSSYMEVKSFLEEETSDKVTSLDMDIEEGLKIAGDDTYELIEKFIKKYDLKYDGLDISEHFLSEGEQFPESLALLHLVLLPILIVIYFLRFLTFGKVDFTKAVILPDIHRKTSGMTFGDLITWHLAGNFRLRNQTRILLPVNS